MTIIALAGVAGAGKDTFADVLIKKHGFTRIALADPLRELCSKVFRIEYKYFLDSDKKDAPLQDGRLMLDYHHIDKIREHVIVEWGYDINHEARESMEEFYGEEFETPRDILRCVGTKLLRKCVSDSIWIDLALDKLKKVRGRVVITDCRFENERDVFRKFGALVCLIKRGESEMKEHEFNLGEEDEYDIIFDNSGTLTQFQSTVNMWYTLRRDELDFYKVFKYE